MGQCEVLRDGAFDLHVHFFLELTASTAAAAVNDDNVDENQAESNPENGPTADLTGTRGRKCGVDQRRGLLTQCFVAFSRRFFETSTNRVENSQRFNLSAICLFVNHNRGVDVGSKVPPVRNLLINQIVRAQFRLPLIGGAVKAVRNALIRCVPVELEEVMCSLRTSFIDDAKTRRMDSLNITPPHFFVSLFDQIVPQTLLSQIFHNDFLAFDVQVGWFHSAILAAAVAVVFDVPLVAVGALPEHVVGRKDSVLTKLLLHQGEVFKEIQSSVIT